MKAIFLQNAYYNVPEGRLPEYHGAVFAQEFQRRGWDAVKNVFGNPEKDIPISPLLGVSSPEQRISPEYWRRQDCDLIVFYNGRGYSNIPVMRAIKEGSPRTKLFLKLDLPVTDTPRTPRGILNFALWKYVAMRHGRQRNGDHDQCHPLTALAISAKHTMRALSSDYVRKASSLYEYPDFVTYENENLIEPQCEWFSRHACPDYSKKFMWLGFSVGSEFAYDGTPKKPYSVISVANWKHAKDMPLQAAALAIAFRKNPHITFTFIGNNSAELEREILKREPAAATRIRRIDEVSHNLLPQFLKASQVFMMCSHTEGYCSAVAEALCAGCSAALTRGIAVPCFDVFAADGCGTQAVSRRPEDMAAALLDEINAWERGQRDPAEIAKKWSKTLAANLADLLISKL